MKKIDDVYKLPDCVHCENTRLVDYRDELYGARKIKCKYCQENELRIKLLKKSFIPENYLVYDFDDYDPNIGGSDEIIKKNKKTVSDVTNLVTHRIAKIVELGTNFFFSGKPASGKTLIATSTLKKIILNHGYNGVYVNCERLILFANNHLKNGSHDYKFTLQDLEHCDFLLIDDVDLIVDPLLPSMARVVINDIFKKRIQNRKSCILTSTKSLGELLNDKYFISDFEHKTIPCPLIGQYKRCCDDMIAALMK